METTTLSIRGMGCRGCVSGVTKVLNDVAGVSVEEVTVGSAVITRDPSLVTDAAIAEALKKAGYEVTESAPLRNEDNAPQCHVRS